MHETRWWSIAVVGTAAVLASMLVVSVTQPWKLNLALTAIAIFIAFWFGVGARAEAGSRGSVLFVIVVVLFGGAVALADPSLAVAQAVAFPLIWTRLNSTVRSVIASTALAISAGVGTFFSSGADLNALLGTSVIEGLSLVFAIALGLWITRIIATSEDRGRLIDELRATQHQVALLNQHAGENGERERLAREIHDTIAQDLTGLVLLAQQAARDLSTGDAAKAAEQLAVLEDAARATLAETRALVASTATTPLDTGGIAAALERLGQRYERETDLTVTVRVDAAPTLSRDLEVVLLRCAQEGLANVRKHAGAQAVTLTLASTTSGLTLTVADDGHGFDPATPSSGFGLSGMRERLALVGGSFDLASSAAGTSLTVRV